ncbi:MAG: TatD family hydrolase [Acidimicrobiales bacterium]
MTVPGGAGVGWLDSHCHLQEEYLGGAGETGGPAGGGDEAAGVAALTDTLGRAVDAGVGALVCVGTDPGTSAQALALAGSVAAGKLGERVPRLWATAGLHPHQASSGVDAVARLVSEAVAAGNPALVAVGECGLDYHYDHSPRPAQRAAFAEQIALAHRHRLALVIHARQAWDDVFTVLGAEGVPERTVLHCFTGGPGEARRCLDAGMYVSFSGIVTFKNAGEVREAAALCPVDRLLIETDSPFLAPVPHRGKPNEPSFVPLVGAAVAEAKGMDPAEVARITADNAARVFGLPER